MWRFVETRAVVAAAIGMLGGICWVFEQPSLPDASFALVWVGSGGVVLLVLWRLRSTRTPPTVITVLILMLFFVTGITLASIQSQGRLSNRLGPALHGSDILVRGTIDGLVTQGTAYTGFVLNDVVSVGPQIRIPERIKLAWYGKAPALEPGERWQLVVRLREIHGTQNPGGFDAERWALAQNIGAKGYVRETRRAERVARSPQFSVDAMRARIVARIDANVTQPSAAGVLRALAVGDRAGLSQVQWQTFRDTGTSHLIAISGLHIGFVAMLGCGVVVMLLKIWSTPCRYMPARIIGVGVGVVAAAGYAALAGFSVSTQRALIMVVIVAVALLARSRPKLVRALSFALIVVLLLDPLTPLSSGLWLSFGAVALIAAIAGASHDLRSPGAVAGSFKQRALYSVSVWARLQFVLSVAMVPAGLMLFGQSSLCSLFANALAIPWTTFLIVPSLLTSLMLEPISTPLSNVLLQFSALAVSLMNVVLERLAALPLATVSGPAPGLLALTLFVIATLTLTLARLAPLAWLTLLWCLPVALPSNRPVTNELRVTALDVGQGLSVVVQTSNHTLVFDTGARAGASDAGARIVVPFLKASGIRKIDMLMVSHGDNDHAGGVRSVQQAYTDVRLMVGDIAIGRGGELCQPGARWEWDEVNFKVLAPLASSGASKNDRSCVLQVTSPWGVVLLTGDIESQGEAALIKAYGATLHADVLVVPHHGAKTSSTLPFLHEVAPNVALVSAGYRNRFGHPHQRVLDRYADLGVTTLNTATSGALAVSLSEAGVRVEQFRQTHRRFWYR